MNQNGSWAHVSSCRQHPFSAFAFTWSRELALDMRRVMANLQSPPSHLSSLWHNQACLQTVPSPTAFREECFQNAKNSAAHHEASGWSRASGLEANRSQITCFLTVPDAILRTVLRSGKRIPTIQEFSLKYIIYILILYMFLQFFIYSTIIWHYIAHQSHS